MANGGRWSKIRRSKAMGYVGGRWSKAMGYVSMMRQFGLCACRKCPLLMSIVDVNYYVVNVDVDYYVFDVDYCVVCLGNSRV